MRTHVPVDAAAEATLQDQQQRGQLRLVEEPLPEEDFRAVELKWLQDHQVTLRDLYPGEWIAIDGPRLVAHAGDLAALVALSSAAGHPNPFITAIPSEAIISFHA